MTTREKILQAVLQNQPPSTALPDTSAFKGDSNDLVQKYMNIFKAIGGSSFLVDDLAAVKILIAENFDVAKRIVTTLPELNDTFELITGTVEPHSYHDIELAIINAHFSVAENGAVWLTEDVMGQRI